MVSFCAHSGEFCVVVCPRFASMSHHKNQAKRAPRFERFVTILRCKTWSAIRRQGLVCEIAPGCCFSNTSGGRGGTTGATPASRRTGSSGREPPSVLLNSSPTSHDLQPSRLLLSQPDVPQRNRRKKETPQAGRVRRQRGRTRYDYIFVWCFR